MGINFPKSDIKQQVDFTDILFRQIDRVAEVSVMNPQMFPVAIDILAGMVSFLGKVGAKADPTDTPEQRYLKSLNTFEKVIRILNDNNLILKYRLKASLGKIPKE